MRRNIVVIYLGIVIFLGIWLLVQIKLHIIPEISRVSFKKTYKIRIGCSSLTPIHCMFGEIFQRTDILKKQGLEGEVIFFAHGGDQSEACQANKIDTTFSCEVPAISQLKNCPDLIIIGTPGSLGRIALIVPQELDIFSLHDLKGKTILIHEGASATMMARKWLQSSGLDPDHDVKLIYSDKDSILNRLYSKEGDAIVSWDPWLEIFLKKYGFRIVKERLFWSVIVVSEKYLQRFPNAVARYEEALKEALWWASNHKDIVSEWVSAQSGLELDVVKKVMRLNKNWNLPKVLKNEIKLGLTVEDINILKECNDYMKNTGQIPVDYDIKDKIMPTILDK